MTEFERELVHAFNRHFEAEGVNGIAYRRKQHRFSSQFVDVLVDSAIPDYYLAIENKSVKTDATNKLYFSQHFSVSDDGHQVERITDFLERSGRRGYLALELRRGMGKPRKAYMIPWNALKRRYDNGETGIHLDDLSRFFEIDRSASDYSVGGLFGVDGA